MSDSDAEPVEPVLADGPPPRPAIVSGLPQREEITRPRRITVIRWLIRLSVLAFTVPTVHAALRQGEIRNALATALEDRAPDYELDQIARAVDIGLAALALLGLAFCLTELSAAATLGERKRGGRSLLMVIAVLHLPTMLVTSAFRDGGLPDLVWTAVQAGTLLVALALAYSPASRRWLDAKAPLLTPTMRFDGA